MAENYSFAEKKRIRKSFEKISSVMALPDILEVQTNSYQHFLQSATNKEKRLDEGLEKVFRSIFPIVSVSGNAKIDYLGYELGDPEFDVFECLPRGRTYEAPLHIWCRITFIDKSTGEENLKSARDEKVYMGTMPLMTEHGTFVINGTERVVVSQLHRSPGLIFDHDKGKTHSSGKLLYSSRVIPYRGSWLDFEFDHKDLVYIRIDRRRKLYASILLKSLGLSSQEILDTFYESESYSVNRNGNYTLSLNTQKLVGRLAPIDIIAKDGTIIIEQGKRITARHIRLVESNKIKTLELPKEALYGLALSKDYIDETSGEVLFACNSLIDEDFLAALEEAKIKEISVLYINELESGPYISDTLRADTTATNLEALAEIYRMMRPGEPPTKEAATLLFENLFFNADKYDLSGVGRMKFNKRLGREELVGDGILTKEDILEVMKTLVDIRNGKQNCDDIDHLGNRRVRSVGELVENQARIGVYRMERAIKEKMTTLDVESAMPQDLINAKPLTVSLKDFFASSQLSQFMDQTNPLSEITHKRRVSALGPGGLTRERAGFEVRDVHPTHYGRICPIETPEGPNIGLINSLSTYAKINKYGFIESPYKKVKDGVVQNNVEYLSAMEETKFTIAQANTKLDKNGKIIEELVSCRQNLNFLLAKPDTIDYIDVSPKQLVSVAASLIPFLENDDANRALMGSNMMRQAVPLLKPESPLVGTGIESDVALDSGVTIVAKRDGTVDKIDGKRIVIKATEETDFSKSGVDIYNLQKFKRSNQNTCINQKPLKIKFTQDQLVHIVWLHSSH